MPAPLLALQDIALTFGGTELFEAAELVVSPGERVALVGRNGSGKSTLLRIAAGAVEPDSGRRFLEPGATLRYLPQEPDLSGHETVLGFVAAGLSPGDEPHRATQLLEALGLGGEEHPATLSGGEARRAALARALAPRPDVLLLDEPTNHLDLPAIEWLEAELSGMHSAMVLISHDRRFLAALSERTVWLDRGTTRRLDKGFAAFEAWRDAVLEEEERDRHKLERRIAREEHWLRYGVTARRKRNVGRLERLTGLRRDKREARRQPGGVDLRASEARASGSLVAEAEGVFKSYGGKAVVADFSIRVRRGERLGIVGPNGAGKTTLIGLLTGQIAPDAGSVRLGANVALAILDQGRARLDPALSLQAALTGGGSDSVTINGASRHVVAYMRDFLFGPEQARTPIGRLSGGERARVSLARVLALPSNVLVLDEPTNDLDLETLDLLEEMVSDYHGTVILVSHDRDFLDRVASSVLASEGNGRWTEYAGGYSDMLAQRGADLAPRPAPEKPERRARETAAPAPSVAPRKLGFKQKHALETLPGEIGRLEAEIARLGALLEDPGLYARDPAAFADHSEALASAREKLAAAEDEWLALEMLREEIEAGN